MLIKALKVLPRALAGDPIAIALILACGIPELIKMIKENQA